MKRGWHPWAWGVALALIAYAPALYAWDASGWGDWQQFHHWWEVGRVSITRWGEFPLMDPHHCGGVPMWGQPQMQYVAPTWWITALPFGTVHGHKVFILLHHVVGFAGMVTVARRLYHLRAVPSALAGLAWAFSGYFAWRGVGGHGTFLAFHYIPFIFYCWRKTNHDLRYAGGVGALMGLQLMEGGTYPFPLTFLLIAFDFLAQLARGEWRTIRTALITGPLAGMVGAIRLWPVYVTMSRFPRETRMEDSQTLTDVIESLTAREPHPWIWGHRWVWAEYGSYIGWSVLVLAGLGAGVALVRRKHWHLVVGAAVFCACAMGNVDAHWPWPLLHELPVFKNFHVPSRFHVILTFYLALLAALALDRGLIALVRDAATKRTHRALIALGWLLVFGVAVDVLSNDVRLAARWDGPPVSGEVEEEFHLIRPAGYGGYIDTYRDYPERNVGTTLCYDPVPWNISPALWTGEVPQARFEPRSAGEVHDTDRTNQTISAHVTLTEPARLVFNTNWDPDWELNRWEAPVEDRGRLAVDLPAGEHRVVARYAPSDLPWSALTTAAGLLLGVLLLLASPRRLRRRPLRGLAPRRGHRS